MASFEKFTAGAVYNEIRHVERTIENSSNENIDPDLIGECYKLSPYRDMSDYSYYRHLVDNSYLFNRSDVKTAFGIVSTAPQDLSKEREDDFFQATYDFIAERYGEDKIVSAAVHKDESNCRPHIHVIICPRVEDPKHEQGYKICMSDVIGRNEYRDFHVDYQHYITNVANIPCTVKSGITRQQGGNKNSSQYKAELAERQKDPNALKKAWGVND